MKRNVTKKLVGVLVLAGGLVGGVAAYAASTGSYNGTPVGKAVAAYFFHDSEAAQPAASAHLSGAIWFFGVALLGFVGLSNRRNI